MCVKFEIDVLGFEEVKKRLHALPRTWQGKVIRPSLREGAKIILAATMANAPRFSGKMAATFYVRASRTRKRKNTIGMLVLSGTREELGLTGNTKAGKKRGYYPSTIEFGSKDGKHKPTGFMKRALDSTRAAAMAAIAQGITNRINGTNIVDDNGDAADFDTAVLR